MRFPLIFLGLMLPAVALAQLEYSSMGRQTGLQNQLHTPGPGDWAEWTSTKPPGFTYRAWTTGLTIPVNGIVTMPVPVQPGTYRVWVKSELAASSLIHHIIINFGTSGDVDRVVNDKDASGLWADFGVHTVTAPFSTVNVSMNAGGATIGSLGFMGIYFTSDTTAFVTKDDYAQTWATPSSEDTSTAKAGNYIKNSSFEGGPGEITVFPNEAKWMDEIDFWSADQAHTGTHSFHLNTKDCIQSKYYTQLHTRPYMLRPNRRHSAGVWVRATGAGAKVELKMIPSLETPKDENGVAIPGISDYPTFTSGVITIAASNTWTQVKCENKLLIEYPLGVTQYGLEILLQDVSTTFPPDIYFDDLQFAEGATLPAYQASFPQELYIANTTMGGRYFIGRDSTRLALRVSNIGSGADVPVNWQVWDSTFKLITNGTSLVTCPANGLGELQLTFDSLPNGPYRLNGWLANGSENETYFCRQTIPVAVVPEQSLFGNHLDNEWYAYQLAAGINWNRCLSPMAWFRWELTEPTQGAFNYHDDLVNKALSSQKIILATLYQKHATWANASFFQTATVPTGFVIGEDCELYQDINGAITGTGSIVWVPPAGNPAAPGIQIKITSGAGAALGNSPKVRGLTSGAQATITTVATIGTDFQYHLSPNFPALTNYIAQTVNHWKTKIKYWEICNEPHLDSSMPKYPMTSNPTNYGFYAAVAVAATQQIKAICPDCKIIGLGGVNSVNVMDDIMTRCGTPITSQWEATSVHYYESGFDATGTGGKYRLENLVDLSALKGTPNVWHTETGVYNNTAWYGPYANWRNGGSAIMKYRDCENQLMSWTVATDRVLENVLLTIGSRAVKHFAYDSRWYHQYGDAVQAFDRTYTELDLRETLKPHAVARYQLSQLIEGGQGLGNATNLTHSRVWRIQRRDGTFLYSLCNFAGNPGYRSMTWSLTPDKYLIYDAFGNASTPVGSKVIYSARPTLIVSKPGTTQAQMDAAVVNATWATELDTTAPNLVFGAYPKNGVVTDLQKHLVRVRWLAWDDIDYLQAAWIDGTSFRNKVDAGAFSEWGQQTFIDLANPSSGSHTITVEARDKSLNPTSGSVTFTVP